MFAVTLPSQLHISFKRKRKKRMDRANWRHSRRKVQYRIERGGMISARINRPRFGRPETVMEDVGRWRGYPSQVSLADRRTTMGLRMEARDDGPGGRAVRWGIN